MLKADWQGKRRKRKKKKNITAAVPVKVEGLADRDGNLRIKRYSATVAN